MEEMQKAQNIDQGQESILFNFFCFRNILETAIRYWKVALICALLGLGGAFVATKWLIAPVYTSQATVFSWRNESKDAQNDNSIVALRQLQMAQMLINDYKALLDSDRVKVELRRRIEKDFLEKNPGLSGGPKKLWYSTSIDTRRESRVLTIVSQARNPKLAQYVAEQTARIFEGAVKDIMQMDNVQIVDHARMPLAPTNKSMKRNLPLGFVVGLAFGIGLALLLGFIDQTIKNPEQAKRYFDIPIMGAIPKNNMPERRSALIGEILDHAKSQEVIEAYRLLRTNLQYLAPKRSGDKGGEVFMFTSSIPHEGKSSSIALVSVLTARAGKKVLLIDADMHKPIQSRIFNLRSGAGFVSVLTGDKTVDEVVQHVEECLDVMPCGPIPPNPSELLMSERMPQLLKELRDKYDYIFVDITPALFLSDPLIVKPMVDGVLFMIGCSQTKIGMIQRTLRQLQQVSKTPIGLVVNKFDRKEAGNRYGYYGYYSYYSYYSHDDAEGGKSRHHHHSNAAADSGKKA